MSGEADALHMIIDETAEVLLSLAEAWGGEHARHLLDARAALLGDRAEVESVAQRQYAMKLVEDLKKLDAQ